MGGMNKIMALMIGAVVGLLALIIVVEPIANAATETTDATSTADFIATGGTINLGQNPSWYGIPAGTTQRVLLDGMSLSDPGTSISLVTLTSNRGSITITGDGFTPGENTLSYVTESGDSTENIILKALPFLIAIGVAGSMFAAAGFGGQSAYSGSGSESIMSSAITVIAGVIMLPIVQQFVTVSKEAYASSPEFFGVELILGFIVILYVLALVVGGLGNVVGGVRSRGGMSGMGM